MLNEWKSSMTCVTNSVLLNWPNLTMCTYLNIEPVFLEFSLENTMHEVSTFTLDSLFSFKNFLSETYLIS